MSTLSEESRQIVASLAHRAGPDADTATTAHAIISTLQGMDGYEVARTLRLTPALDGVTLIALTGWGTDADRLKTDAAGFDHHLTKPVSFDEILRMLTQLERVNGGDGEA